MSVRWERLAGNTEVFAFKVAFHDDPDGGTGATEAESLSWGGFQIWVQGRNLCYHWEDGDSCDSVYWYLLPMLEWVTYNWDALLHEQRPCRPSRGGSGWQALELTKAAPAGLSAGDAEKWDTTWELWWRRHSLLASRDGGLFPDVTLRRWMDKMELSWAPSKLPGTRNHCVFAEAAGCARVDPAAVASALHEVLSQSVSYLLSRSPQEDRLLKLREAIDGLSSQDRTEARLAWLAGFQDAFTQVWKEARHYIAGKGHEVANALMGAESSPLFIKGDCHAALMFGSLAPQISVQDALQLAELLAASYTGETEQGPLADLAREAPLHDTPSRPWEQGYELAEEITEALAAADGQPDSVDIEAVLVRLGIDVRPVSLQDSNTRAVAIAGHGHRPTILLNLSHMTNQYPTGQRFILAHEICHLLFDRTQARRLAIASGPWAPPDIERRANAFAAMFLMPRQVVQRAVSQFTSPLASVPSVARLAETFHTSFRASLEHLRNLGYLTSSEVDSIREDNDMRDRP